MPYVGPRTYIHRCVWVVCRLDLLNCLYQGSVREEISQLFSSSGFSLLRLSTLLNTLPIHMVISEHLLIYYQPIPIQQATQYQLINLFWLLHLEVYQRKNSIVDQINFDIFRPALPTMLWPWWKTIKSPESSSFLRWDVRIIIIWS